MDPSELSIRAQGFKATLDAAKADVQQRDFDWYPYGSLDNFHLLDLLLEGRDRTVFDDIRGQPVADVGAADGETAFFLESLGHEVDVIDYGPTNFNGCRGVRALARQFGSRVGIHETDLDAQFALPRERYGLTLFLGILYHLKNPYFALETLARHTGTLLLSTRIASHNRPAGDHAGGAKPQRFDMSEVPVAYLVAPDECNGDATNFWIFSECGLRRILDRTGWNVGSFRAFGAVGNSDPASQDGDERAFCIARSRHFGG